MLPKHSPLPQVPFSTRWRSAAAMTVFAWLLAPAVPLGAQQLEDDSGSGQWERLEGCALEPDSFVDGDSFRVVHQGRKYIFRLYFVDAPETDATLEERIEDQAAYFGIPAGRIESAGKLAAEFTRRKLSAGPFTVLTRWQNAMGRSSLARFYAIVFVGNENLAEELVRNGLARIYGYRASWPDGPRATTFINQLKNLELAAREQGKGVWNQRQFARATTTTADIPEAKAGSARAAATEAPRLDLNTASQADLRKLPGIGKVLAERIIAHRPFQSLAELDAIPGIGEKTMDKLRPLVRVGPEK